MIIASMECIFIHLLCTFKLPETIRPLLIRITTLPGSPTVRTPLPYSESDLPHRVPRETIPTSLGSLTMTVPSADLQREPSGLRVFALGLLMTGSVGIRVTEFLPLSLSLTWFLPLLAAWFAHRHGVQVLRAWWPLALLPSFGITLGSAGISFGISTAALLLALIIATAVDARIVVSPLAQWIRQGGRWPIIGAFCLLFVAAMEYGSRLGSFRINLMAIAPAVLLLLLIRWESLGSAIWPQLGRAAVVAVSLLGAAIILSGLVISGGVTVGPFSLRAGSSSLATLVAVTCFGLAVVGGSRLRTIGSLLAAGLVVERLLVLARSGALGAMLLMDGWPLWIWEVLFGSLAAALTGGVFGPFLRRGEFRAPFAREMRTLLLALLMILVLTPLFNRYAVPAYGTTPWMMAAVAFAAGVHWGRRSLVFAPPLLQILYLLAATAAPAGTGGHPADALVTIGLVSFPFAFCGAFFAISRQLAPLDQAAVAPRPPTGQPAPAVVDVSELAKIVGQIDRSATWRSFLVAAAPFVVLWQWFELYGFRGLVDQASETFGGEPMLENWHYALAAMLALAPLLFALWDWIDRRDGLRMLALLTGCVVGALAWQAFGGLLGVGIKEILGDVTDVPLEARVAGAGGCAFALVMLGSGLLAGVDRRIARPVFLTTCGLALAAVVAALGSLWMEEPFDARTLVDGLAALAACLVLAVALARFVSLRLVLAGDRPRELLFGALRDKGFWVRMAAASGLPSSSWRISALTQPAFWALFAARFVVYTGGVLTRSWSLIGAVIVALGHLLFHAGKRLSAREMWRPRALSPADRPILFLRGFDDDQCTFRRHPWNLLARWLDLWSFRRNLDEAMVDELAQFGPVVALGRPGDKRTPFGAMRHYSADADWQRTLADAARSAQAIILVASDSPGVQWEYDLLKNEGMLGKVLLLFRPDDGPTGANRHAAEWFCPSASAAINHTVTDAALPVAMRLNGSRPMLIVTHVRDAATYVLSLRLHIREHASMPVPRKINGGTQ
ncbi:MAG: hypothetical protein EYC67_06080 [Betaproteobacteria bacterium]|nr:MAG: hypothetical protein EYC67_06080 [Betaproteobacteria bacterium]